MAHAVFTSVAVSESAEPTAEAFQLPQTSCDIYSKAAFEHRTDLALDLEDRGAEAQETLGFKKTPKGRRRVQVEGR